MLNVCCIYGVCKVGFLCIDLIQDPFEHYMAIVAKTVNFSAHPYIQ